MIPDAEGDEGPIIPLEDYGKFVIAALEVAVRPIIPLPALEAFKAAVTALPSSRRLELFSLCRKTATAVGRIEIHMPWTTTITPVRSTNLVLPLLTPCPPDCSTVGSQSLQTNSGGV